ncbi:MAG: DUF7487 domain-containing protein, partial [Acholeplasmataceae bacterium]
MNERVKAWMESLSPDVKAKASSIRRCILSYDSHINEGWSYGMPSYKIKKTFLEKYGVENSFQNEKVKQKIKNTNLEKYGVKNPSQCEE